MIFQTDSCTPSNITAYYKINVNEEYDFVYYVNLKTIIVYDMEDDIMYQTNIETILELTEESLFQYSTITPWLERVLTFLSRYKSIMPELENATII